MSRHKWREGEPPHVGWWQASRFKDGSYWRWWDGKCWSQPACDSYPPWLVEARAAAKTDFGVSEIWWTTYWPKDARVPRVNPRSRK